MSVRATDSFKRQLLHKSLKAIMSIFAEKLGQTPGSPRRHVPPTLQRMKWCISSAPATSPTQWTLQLLSPSSSQKSQQAEKENENVKQDEITTWAKIVPRVLPLKRSSSLHLSWWWISKGKAQLLWNQIRVNPKERKYETSADTL